MITNYLTSKQAAELLGCSTMTITRLVKDGRFPGARKLNAAKKGSPLRIPRIAVEEYLKSQIVTPEIEETSKS